MKSKIWIWVLLAIVLVQGAYLLLSLKQPQNTVAASSLMPLQEPSTNSAPAEKVVVNTPSTLPDKSAATDQHSHTRELDNQQHTPALPGTNTQDKQGYVDSAQLTTILGSSEFKQVIDRYVAYSDKTTETYAFEDKLKMYLTNSELNHYLSDYQIGCDNSICFGYLRATDKTALANLVQQFIKSAPLNSSGYFTLYETTTDQTDSQYEYRMSFNADPSINTITSVDLKQGR